jgi:chromosome segregation ATPase
MEKSTKVTSDAVVNPAYEKLVADARLLARDTLRTRNIRAQVEQIAEFNKAIGCVNQEVKDTEDMLEIAKKDVLRAEYQLGLLDAQDPDFNEKKKSAEERVENANETVKAAEAVLKSTKEQAIEDVESLKKDIEECNGKIARWANGDNKVQLENLNELAKTYIENAMTEVAKSLGSAFPSKA